MKNKITRNIVLSFSVFSIMCVAGLASAQTAPPTAPPLPAQTTKKATILADINLSNLVIVSRSQTEIGLTFDIVNNGKTPQSDITNSIELTQNTSEGQVVADVFTSDQKISIGVGKTTHVEITYPIPPTFSGSYDMWVKSKTTEGLTVGIGSAGNVELIALGTTENTGNVPATGWVLWNILILIVFLSLCFIGYKKFVLKRNSSQSGTMNSLLILLLVSAGFFMSAGEVKAVTLTNVPGFYSDGDCNDAGEAGIFCWSQEELQYTFIINTNKNTYSPGEAITFSIVATLIQATPIIWPSGGVYHTTPPVFINNVGVSATVGGNTATIYSGTAPLSNVVSNSFLSAPAVTGQNYPITLTACGGTLTGLPPGPIPCFTTTIYIDVGAATPFGTVSLSGALCSIGLNASTCNVNLLWSVTNPTQNPNLYNATRFIQYATGVSGVNMPATTYNNASLSYGSNDIQARDGVTSLFSYILTPGCSSGLTWNGSICTAAVPATVSLTAIPSTITAGQSSNLTWTSTGITGSCFSTGDWPFANKGTAGGPESTGVLSQGSYTYSLECWNGVNQVAYDEELITVNAASFNFSLTDGGSKEVTQGSSVTNSITASLSSGSTQPISFSILSGLPTGVTGTFSPTSCSPSPTCSSTLTLTAASGAVTGSSSIIVRGVGGGVTRDTTFTLTVNAASPPSVLSILSCNFDKTSAFLGEDVVMTVTLNPLEMGSGDLTYNWSGDIVSSSSSTGSLTTRFRTIGRKRVMVQVTDSSVPQLSAYCDNYIQVDLNQNPGEF